VSAPQAGSARPPLSLSPGTIWPTLKRRVGPFALAGSPTRLTRITKDTPNEKP
jgi:hypothetical protein